LVPVQALKSAMAGLSATFLPGSGSGRDRQDEKLSCLEAISYAHHFSSLTARGSSCCELLSPVHSTGSPYSRHPASLTAQEHLITKLLVTIE
jgi:hypothetical protein